MGAGPRGACAAARPEMPEPTMATFMGAPRPPGPGRKWLRSVPKRRREGGRRSASGGHSAPGGPKGFATRNGSGASDTLVLHRVGCKTESSSPRFAKFCEESAPSWSAPRNGQRKLLLDGTHQRAAVGGSQAGVLVHHRAIACQQVFVEVPARRLARLLGQLLEERIGLRSLHAALGKHGKAHAEGALAELGDLLVAAGFLGEIVGWKAK